ncbi:MAG: hypothetical protein RIB58_11000 [Phycisphaerales bacterium]|jgi:hypothetical protein
MPTAQTSKALALMAMLFTLAACSSNPPPRPLPSPTPRTEAPSQTQQQRTAQRPAAQASQPQSPTQQPAEQPVERTAEQTTEQTTEQTAEQSTDRQPTPGLQPDWYKPGVQTLDGAEHRAFAATAPDVRDARRQAMAEAYDAYPKGQVAAYQAVRLADGGWRFYVLMAAGG